ncbi:hypothetical protein K438DRAFT_2092296 [Mycena galopus ATCC 62051]|nr:hypothetical protein K438DRAFT_2092296 [Mycena galopus ATCC 62051]
MPPKANMKKRKEDDFLYSADGTKMLCKKCYQDGIGDDDEWIGATDRVGEKHLKSNCHHKALRVQQEQECSARQMEDERRIVAPGVLNHVEIHVEHLAGPSTESFRATGADLGFGEDMGPRRTVQDELRNTFEGFGVWNVAETTRRLGFEDVESIPRAQEEDEDEILAEILHIADLIDHDPTGINAALGESQLPKADEKWFLYPSKLMFLLDFIDNLPRLRLSSALMRMFIFVLKEAKCQDTIPSYNRFQDFQKNLREQCGTPTLPCCSPLGNVFFINDVQKMIANDYANPTTCQLLNFYPEITEDGADWAFIIPIHWVVFKGVVHADFLEVKLDSKGNTSVISTLSERLISVAELASDFQNLEHAGAIPGWTAPATRVSCAFYFNVPEGQCCGAVSSTYTNPVEVHDENNETTCVSIFVNADPCDNPMGSEISAHIGGQGNHPCRKCEIGGTQEEKATLEGFHKFFDAGTPRTKESVREELENQIKLTCAGVAAPIKDTQTTTGIKDPYTQFWINDTLSCFKSLVRATPCLSPAEIQQELLDWVKKNRDKMKNPFYATYNKGHPSRDPPHDAPWDNKYIWHVTHTKLSTDTQKTYVPCLQATDTLKILVQTSPFHIGDLVDDPMKFAAWKAAGELAALLWVPEIKNMEQYRADLNIAVANVLDIGEPSPAPICGAIADILWAEDKTALVVLKQLRLLPERDEWYSMLVLVPELTPMNEPCYLLVPGKVCLILCSLLLNWFASSSSRAPGIGGNGNFHRSSTP